MRPLLIGEAPARTTPKGWPPFFGRDRSAKRLWSLGFRVTRGGDDLWQLAGQRPGNVDAINLLDRYPGVTWPAEEAKLVANGLLFGGALDRRSHVILVGRRVARAFSVLESWDWFEWFKMRDSRETLFAAMPHPSGLNRWWNDEKNAARARAWCTGFLSRVDPGTLRGFGPVYGAAKAKEA